MPSNSEKKNQITTIEELNEAGLNNNSSFPEVYEGKKASPECRRTRNIRACRCDWSVRGSVPERDWSGANPRVRLSSRTETPENPRAEQQEVKKKKTRYEKEREIEKESSLSQVIPRSKYSLTH